MQSSDSDSAERNLLLAYDPVQNGEVPLHRMKIGPYPHLDLPRQSVEQVDGLATTRTRVDTLLGAQQGLVSSHMLASVGTDKEHDVSTAHVADMLQ